MTVIDWSTPPGARPDWLMGAGAATPTGVGRVLRAPCLFSALHGYPFLVVAPHPGGSCTW